MLKAYAKEDEEEEQLAGLFLKVCPLVYKLCCPGKGFWPYSTEPVFVNVYGAEETISPTFNVAWRDGTTNRVIAPVRQAGNRFLGSL